jgi:hypothetical protein
MPFRIRLLLIYLSLAVAASAVPVLTIESAGNGSLDGEYTTSTLFVDGLAGDSIPLAVGVAGVELCLESIAGRSYQLQCSEDLASCAPPGEALSGDGGELFVAGLGALGVRKFYRVIVSRS